MTQSTTNAVSAGASEPRAFLAAVADVLIPAAGRMPSGSAAGVAGEGIDRVLAFRDEATRRDFWHLLEANVNRPPGTFIRELSSERHQLFDAFFELVVGAYFLNGEVRRFLGYPGQVGIGVVAPDLELLSELTAPVRERGHCYRR